MIRTRCTSKKPFLLNPVSVREEREEWLPANATSWCPFCFLRLFDFRCYSKALRSDEDPFQGGGGLEGDVGCSIGERSEKLSVSRLKNGMELRKHGKAFVISNTVLTDVHNRWALQHFRSSMTCKGLEWSTCHTLFRLEMMWFKQYVQMLSNSLSFFLFSLLCACHAQLLVTICTHKRTNTWDLENIIDTQPSTAFIFLRLKFVSCIFIGQGTTQMPTWPFWTTLVLRRSLFATTPLLVPSMTRRHKSNLALNWTH